MKWGFHQSAENQVNLCNLCEHWATLLLLSFTLYFLLFFRRVDIFFFFFFLHLSPNYSSFVNPFLFKVVTNLCWISIFTPTGMFPTSGTSQLQNDWSLSSCALSDAFVPLGQRCTATASPPPLITALLSSTHKKISNPPSHLLAYSLSHLFTY